MRRMIPILLSLPLAFALGAAAAAQDVKAKRPACESIARFKIIGMEPTRLNDMPARCGLYFQIPQDACFFYRSRPGGKPIGPICLDWEKGKGGAKVGSIYEIWAKDRPFVVDIIPYR